MSCCARVETNDGCMMHAMDPHSVTSAAAAQELCPLSLAELWQHSDAVLHSPQPAGVPVALLPYHGATILHSVATNGADFSASDFLDIRSVRLLC